MRGKGRAVKFCPQAFKPQHAVFQPGFEAQILRVQPPQGQHAHLHLPFGSKRAHETQVPGFAFHRFFLLRCFRLAGRRFGAHVAVEVQLRHAQLEAQGKFLAPINAKRPGNIVFVNSGMKGAQREGCWIALERGVQFHPAQGLGQLGGHSAHQAQGVLRIGNKGGNLALPGKAVLAQPKLGRSRDIRPQRADMGLAGRKLIARRLAGELARNLRLKALRLKGFFGAQGNAQRAGQRLKVHVAAALAVAAEPDSAVKAQLGVHALVRNGGGPLAFKSQAALIPGGGAGLEADIKRFEWR